MGLEKDSGKLTYVNIKEGRLYTKEKDAEPSFFTALTGTIIGVAFKVEEFRNKTHEIMQLKVSDGTETFLMQMRTDSGYFRGFCNSLKSGDPVKQVRISASSKLEQGAEYPKTTCFVAQDGKALKHFYTRENPGDLPLLETVKFKGVDMWDGSKQIKFWKDWLLSIKWENELFVQEDKPAENKPQPGSNVPETDDLPF